MNACLPLPFPIPLPATRNLRSLTLQLTPPLRQETVLVQAWAVAARRSARAAEMKAFMSLGSAAQPESSMSDDTGISSSRVNYTCYGIERAPGG